MEPEEIGSLNVSIGGDYSGLQSAFAEAQKEAQSAGSDIAQAFTTAADGEQALQSAFERLVAGGATMGEAMAQLQGSFDALHAAEIATTDSTDAAGAAAEQASKGFDDFGQAAGAAAKEASLFGDSAQQIVNSQRDAEAELIKAQEALDQIRAAYSLGEASANDLVRAEQALKAAFDEANPALVASQEAAEKSADSAATLTDKLLALGEALAVTKALVDFGEKALEVASKEEQLSISITALTGSAQAAKDQLEEISKFAFANALGIEQVQAATQKMDAFKFSAEDTARLLQAAADSAAATGNSFDSVATKLGNVALSGNASARSLTTLGISVDQLGAQLNVTGDEATKAFKALDQKDRIDALVGALGTFKGTAEAVANSTAGQFQNLENDFHEVWKSLGDELLPTMSKLVGVVRDDILPAIQGLVRWFDELPAPVKQLAVDAGIFAAALVPVTAGVVALSLAFDGLGKVLPIVAGLAETVGATFTAMVGEEAVATGAAEALGSASTVTAGELAATGEAATALGSVLGFAFASGLAAAVIGLIDLRERLDAAHASLKGLTDVDFENWVKSSVAGMKDATITIDALDQKVDQLKKLFDSGGISLGDYTKLMDALQKKIQTVGADDLAKSMAGLTGQIHLVNDVTEKATDTVSILKDVLEQAKLKVLSLHDSYLTGQTSAADYEKAQNAVTTAEQKLQVAIADATNKQNLSKVAYDEWTEATAKAQKAIAPYLDSIKDLAGSTDILAAKSDTVTSKITLLAVEVVEAQEKLFVLNQRVKDAAAAIDGSATSTENWLHAMKDAAAEADDLKKKTDALVAAQIAAASQVNHISGAIQDLRTAQDVTKDSQTAWAAETKLLTEQLYEAQQRLVQLNEFVKEAATADDGSTAAHERWVKGVEAATKASDDLAAKQKALADAHTKAKEATDNLSETSIGYGVTLTETVVPASKQMQAQTENTTAALAGQTAAAKVAVPALDAVGASARAAAADVGSLSADLKQLTQDFLGLGSAKSSSSSLGSAPSGYYYQVSGNAFTGFKVDLRAIPEGYEVGPAGSLVPIPGYDFSKSSGGGASAGSSSSSSSAPPASTVSSVAAAPAAGKTDTAAAGGTYPGVVIHQAAGEVLLVALTTAGSQAAAAAGSGSGVGSAAQAASDAALAASTTSLTVSTAAGTMANVVGELQTLTGVVAATVTQTQAIASKLALVSITDTNANYTGKSAGGTVVGSSSTNTSVGAGMGNTIGQTITVTNSPYPTGGSAAYLASLGVTPPGTAPAASGNYTPPIQVTVQGNNFTGVSASDMANQLQTLVTNGITRVLRDQGAKY